MRDAARVKKARLQKVEGERWMETAKADLQAYRRRRDYQEKKQERAEEYKARKRRIKSNALALVLLLKAKQIEAHELDEL